MSKNTAGRLVEGFAARAGLVRCPRLTRLVSPRLLIMLLVMVPSLYEARAQNGGEITGTVTDSTGALVPNVDVKITSVETGSSKATKTNGAGIFDFPGLDNGDYNLTASSTGFQVYRKDGIVLNIAETLREDIALAVGSPNPGGGRTVERPPGAV